MERLIQILLSPFSLLYGIAVFLRNKLFDFQILKSKKFDTPLLIGVGNLSVGGTGKTPHVEYLIKLLSSTYNCAILSRGYGRSTSGFKLVTENDTATTVGDEPLQYRFKFKEIVVAVDEDRVNGAEMILKQYPNIDIVILDDVFQHRSILPSFNLLITDYNNRYSKDFLMPSGRLREWRCGSKRADAIIVSKSPDSINKKETQEIVRELKPEARQKVYFSSINYGNLTPFTQKAKEVQFKLSHSTEAIAITGIANPTPFLAHLKKEYTILKHFRYRDHYKFKIEDINAIRSYFGQVENENKIIISTEKDIMRLSLPALASTIEDLPLFYVPIEIAFSEQNDSSLEQEILDYVRTNKRNKKLPQR